MKKNVKTIYFIVGLLIFLGEKLALTIGTGYMLTIDNFGMLTILPEIIERGIDEIKTIMQLGFYMSLTDFLSIYLLEIFIFLYSGAFIIGFIYNLLAFIFGTILGVVMIFIHEGLTEIMTYLVLGIHNLVHTVIYFVLLPIFVLSIVGIPLLILPAISFTLVFLSFKGAGEYLKSNCYTVLQLFYRTDT